MNTLECLLTIKQNALRGNGLIMPVLDRMWCKGDRKAYKPTVNIIASAIKNYLNTTKFLTADIKYAMYPANRKISRQDYQEICIFDKYYSANKNYVLDILSYAAARMLRPIEITYPKEILGITLTSNGQNIGHCNRIEIVADTTNKVNIKLSNVDIISGVINLINKFKYNIIKIIITGEPYSLTLDIDQVEDVFYDHRVQAEDGRIVYNNINFIVDTKDIFLC